MDLSSILEFQSDVINIFVPNPWNICPPTYKKDLALVLETYDLEIEGPQLFFLGQTWPQKWLKKHGLEVERHQPGGFFSEACAFGSLPAVELLGYPVYVES